MGFQENLKLLIFDFDGTLHDLRVDWDDARTALKLQDTSESLGAAIERLKNVDSKQLDKLTEIEEQALRNDRLDALTLAALHKLQGTYKIAIFSRNSSKAISSFMHRHNFNPDLVVGREDVARLKPDPEGISIILDKLGVNPDETLMIGDTWHDLLVAKSAGVKCVIVGDNYSHESEVPPYHIQNIGEIEKILNSLV